ncbi:response regulator [Haliovirga abyssi]|uniref:Chemotaxis protein CheY n=1 Tax=Haliovirga abyssi TaxID=2996794 RepID=A0AAU9D308_9FUSO|nr:response regulator [Haliovirga abyssi]BDU50389.1 chemotaxis protein CheY [Haliovirga abyssi]
MIKLLVVDDSLFMRQMLKNILPRDKFEVVGEASTGKEAISKFKELEPDLITMDITMPDMDGITAVKEIRRISPEAKVIMCSAMGQKPMIREALEAGAIDFIIKPFDKDKAIKILEAMSL